MSETSLLVNRWTANLAVELRRRKPIHRFGGRAQMKPMPPKVGNKHRLIAPSQDSYCSDQLQRYGKTPSMKWSRMPVVKYVKPITSDRSDSGWSLPKKFRIDLVIFFGRK